MVVVAEKCEVRTAAKLYALEWLKIVHFPSCRVYHSKEKLTTANATFKLK